MAVLVAVAVAISACGVDLDDTCVGEPVDVRDAVRGLDVSGDVDGGDALLGVRADVGGDADDALLPPTLSGARADVGGDDDNGERDVRLCPHSSGVSSDDVDDVDEDDRGGDDDVVR